MTNYQHFIVISQDKLYNFINISMKIPIFLFLEELMTDSNDDYLKQMESAEVRLKMEQNPDYMDYLTGKKCWFCKQTTASDAYMYRAKDKTIKSSDVLKTEYEFKEYNVPRCQECANVHNKINGTKIWLFLSFFLLWWLPFIIFPNSPAKGWISFILFVVGILVFCIKRRILFVKYPQMINFKDSASGYYDIIKIGKYLTKNSKS